MGNSSTKTPEKFGYKIGAVFANGPGEKCGLNAATDLIVQVDGQNVYELTRDGLMNLVKVSLIAVRCSFSSNMKNCNFLGL